ncbi:DGQHR domain-containing protein [Myxococcota bacterium]
MTEDPRSISFPCLRVRQPIGEFYIGTIVHRSLCDITYFDVRRMLGDREVETYLGIQRPLAKKRVREISEYVSTVDACFPTAVLLAVPAVCAEYSEQTGKLCLSNYLEPEDPTDRVFYRDIAKVLDGQHRIEGLRDYQGDDFEVNVSIFVDADIAEQAYIFSTVNLAQTKVNKSLAYDLYELAKARSPQKVCHNIAVALDSSKGSPFFHRIKRLGRATEGRHGETITQATIVKALMRYVSRTELRDRDLYMRRKKPKKATDAESLELIFRNMVLDERDVEVTDVLWNYFGAASERWATAWNSTQKGMMLSKTNGFRGLMRFLRDAYLALGKPGDVPSKEEFLSVLKRIGLPDDHFTTERFRPGSSGESEMYRQLLKESGL